MLRADYSSEQPAHPDRASIGTAQVRKNWSSIFDGVPDFHADLLDAAADGETAAARLYMSDVEEAGRGIDEAVMWTAGER